MEKKPSLSVVRMSRVSICWSLAMLYLFSALTGCNLEIRQVNNKNSTSAHNQPFAQHWPFDALSDANYIFDPTKIDLTGGVCRLSPADQIDDDNTGSGFGGATLSGAAWDSANAYVRLDQTGTPTNMAELDASWTPQYSSLVAYWKMDNTWTDSVGSVNLTAGGAPTFTTSAKLGSRAGSFGGTNDYASATSAAISSTNNWTMSAWIYPTDISTAKRIAVYVGTGGTNGYGIAASGSIAGRVSVLIDNTWVDQTTSYNLNQWHHVVAVRNAGTLTVYVNGVAQATTSGVAPTTASAHTYIGWDGTNSKMQGQVDDVAIWNVALSATDVTTLYSRQSALYSGTVASRVMDARSTGQSWTKLFWTPTLPFYKELPDYASSLQNELSSDYSSLVGSTGSTGDNDLMNGIIGLWHLDETVMGSAPGGTDFADSSGNGFHGTKGSSTVYGISGPLLTAVKFDRTSNAPILLTTSALVHPTDVITVSAWLNFDELGVNNLTVMGTPQTGGYSIRASKSTTSGQCANPSEVCFSVRIGGAYQPVGIANTNFTVGRWSHVVGTYDGSNLKFYLNGKLAATNPVSGAIQYTTPNNPFCIGSDPSATDCVSGSNMSGGVDEVALWHRALTAAEILQLYRRGANRIKYQVRICTASDCSDDSTGANWKGPNGTNQTYFSELYNLSSQSASPSGTVNASLPVMTFSNFTSPPGMSRFFQYRAVLESDDTSTACNYGSGATWCSPEMKSVTVDPVHYDSTAPTIIGKTGVAYYTLTNYLETLGASCSSGVGYNLGIGATAATATWYWWDSAANSGSGGWTAADGTSAKSNSAAVISLNTSSFANTIGLGTVYIKAYLKSSGITKCELSDVELDGKQ